MAGMSKETEQKISQLSLIEQNNQNLLLQKQQFQAQLIEIESALNELKDAEKAYKIVGGIMVDAKKDVLEKELTEKKEMLDIRIKNFEKQEEKLKERAKKLQEEVLEEIKAKEK